MQSTAYFLFLSKFFTVAYLYLCVPVSLILESYILIVYSINMIKKENTSIQNRFRRGVAVFLPFLLTMYCVLISEKFGITLKLKLPYYVLLIIGIAIGVLFMTWISGIDDDNELFATLSCFVSSLIFFSIITVYIITSSFEIISIVFGFLFGVSAYVLRYGFSNLDRLKFPKFRSRRIAKP